MGDVRRLLTFMRPYRAALAGLALLHLITAGATLALPWLAGRLFGEAMNGAVGARGPTPVMLAAALIATTLASVWLAIRSAGLGARMTADVQQQAFDHIQSLPLSFHENRGKGDVLALVMLEAARLANFLIATAAATPARLFTALGASIAMFRIDPRLALIVPILLPLFAVLVKLVGRSLRGLALAHQQAEARAFATVEEALDILPATKAFTQEERGTARLAAHNAEVARLSFRQGRIQALIEPLIGLAAAIAALAVLIIAGRSLGDGRMDAAQLVSFLLYAMLLARPVASLVRIYGETQVARGALDRLRTVFDQPPEASGDRPLSGRARGAVCFSDVRFTFPGREPLLRGLDLDLAPGDRVALLGANGAGKTALIHLLLRFYLLDGGRITLDGVDIVTLDLAALRRQIGLVPQTTLLFNGTVADNIAFGADAAPPAAIERAARLAQAHDFIAGFPDGYDTTIGDRGVKLSGGQRQRIALARALIKDPPILILDEATAMFDAEGEAAFVEDCEEALAGRTVILITHRPALLTFATRRVEIIGGQARERDGVSRRRASA